jgi:NAD(P)H-flavin reductase/ferredoxin/fatty-acid desaturase
MKLAQINDKPIQVHPRETLLQAALREGIDFPSSCRVGGCGACKCKLAKGEVKELTETGYLLSAEELAEGTILACQSVPTSDVAIEVDLTPKGVPGVVTGQRKLTHDITELTIQLEEAIDYEAGQFAHVSIEGLDGVVRSYSFATPQNAEGEITFFIRRVPGGKLSTLVNDEDVVGREVRVDGPSGDCWLRGGDAPMIFVAGGSGLAPILAMLREAVEARVNRPAVLLFGAREQRDLYAMEEIEAIAARWRGDFSFEYVLSDAEGDDEWDGARGLVTEHIDAHLRPSSQAYLCGPPPMVDAAMDTLTGAGIDRSDIHFDRFTTQADAPADAPTESSLIVSALHYLKYFSFHLIGLLSAAALLAGGHFVTAGLLGVLTFYVLGDALLGEDTSTPTYRRPAILTAQLWLALPLLAFIVFSAIWSVSSGDFLGFGALVESVTGFDALAARAATGVGQHVAAFVLTGLMIGMVGTIPAHELTHRTWDPVSMLVGRWLLAFSFDTVFAIEHVYGHHRYVSTTVDPATAPRGRSVYAHVLISTWKGNRSAWEIEVDRLRKKGLPVFSPHNAFLRGHLMSVVLVGLAALVGGPIGAAFFVACALWGKALLEIVNYMEHYGMIRNPELPVQPRHSWNTNRRLSSWSMFNLTRHSHHHAGRGALP